MVKYWTKEIWTMHKWKALAIYTIYRYIVIIIFNIFVYTGDALAFWFGQLVSFVTFLSLFAFKETWAEIFIEARIA